MDLRAELNASQATQPEESEISNVMEWIVLWWFFQIPDSHFRPGTIALTLQLSIGLAFTTPQARKRAPVNTNCYIGGFFEHSFYQRILYRDLFIFSIVLLSNSL